MPHSHGQILARWQGSIDGTLCSPLSFLEMVQKSIRDKRLTGVSFSLVTRREGGWFSPKRVYLRISFKKLFFDATAFAAGGTLVAVWWLHREEPGVADLLGELPIVGYFLRKTALSETYFLVDSVEHFQRAVHESFMQVVDRVRENGGPENPSESERQPVWGEIWH